MSSLRALLVILLCCSAAVARAQTPGVQPETATSSVPTQTPTSSQSAVAPANDPIVTDPHGADADFPPENHDDIPEPQRPDPDPSLGDEESPPPAPLAEYRLGLGAGPSLSAGTAPSTTYGVSGLVDLAWRMLHLQITGRYELGGGSSFDTGKLSMRLGGANVALCGRYLAFFFCGSGFVGAFRLEGSNYQDARVVERPYGAVGARVGVDIPFATSWSARILVDGMFPVERVSVTVNDYEAWRTPVFHASGSIFVVWNYP